MKLKYDKGVAGLTVLLSVVTMLFVIGLLVMIFALMGGELATASYEETSASVVNETLTTVTETGEDFTVAGYRDVACTLTAVRNATGGETINSGNYTQTNCNLASTGTSYNNTDWNVSYSYTYEADTTATDVINDTSSSISGVTSWFTIFIVITAMVVLILLTVIIITAIRGSGLMAGGGA